MKMLVRFVVISSLLIGAFGCTSKSSDEVAAGARADAADARISAADANARVTAADAHVRAAVAHVKHNSGNGDAVHPPKATLLIPSGTVFRVSLIDALNTETSSAGDRFLRSEEHRPEP